MELFKLYRGNDNHLLSVHRDSNGDLVFTATVLSWFNRRTEPENWWVILDHFEEFIIENPQYGIKPVPLLVATFDGRKRYFETPADLQAHYSDPSYGLGDEPARVADLLSRKLPVIFGKLTAYREKPWHFNDGLTAHIYGKQSAF